MFKYFMCDLKRLNCAIDFQSLKKQNRIFLKGKNIILNPSFYLICLFRLSSFLKILHIPIIPQIIIFIESIIFSSSIHHSCKIGPGLLIPHCFCIVITGDAEIGDNATIFHEVTIGGNAKNEDGAPKIGNNVRLSEKSRFLPIISQLLNVARRTIAFYFLILVVMFRFYHFSDSLNVTIYAGAKILGPISIGNNVRIGANSVVLSSIPNNALAVGNPARII